MVIRELGYGDHFGEQALLREERRSANVVALSEVEVLSLDRDSFLQLIGDLGEFQRLEKTPHASSCSDLEHILTPTSTRENDRNKAEGRNETLSCSLPNPSLLETPYNQKPSSSLFDLSSLTLDDLEFVATLGVGGFGRVELVQVTS